MSALDYLTVAWLLFWSCLVPVALLAIWGYELLRKDLGFCQCPPVDEAGHRLGCAKGLLEPERGPGR